MHFSMFVFSCFLFDFEAILVPSKTQESLFYIGKSIFFTKAPFRGQVFIGYICVDYFGIIFRCFLGIDYLMPFLMHFYGFRLHF